MSAQLLARREENSHVTGTSLSEEELLRVDGLMAGVSDAEVQVPELRARTSTVSSRPWTRRATTPCRVHR